MTKSELIAALARRQPHLLSADVDLATRHVLNQLSDALARGERIEVRGFGSFALRYRQACIGRNPKTGTAVALPARYLPHFKPGIELRNRVSGHSLCLVEKNPGTMVGTDFDRYKMHQEETNRAIGALSRCPAELI